MDLDTAAKLRAPFPPEKVGKCWLWPGALSPEGYGVFSVHEGGLRRKALAHRVIYELARGTIPDGLQLDHLCRSRRCVNPDHLEAVTVRENLLRGETLAAANLAKDACPYGHEYTEANTYRYRNTRLCKTCRRVSSREFSAQRRRTMREAIGG